MKPCPAIDELCLHLSKYANRRMAIVTNNVATTSWGVASRQALLQAGYQVSIIFSPEHGMNATGADGVAQPDGVDVLTGLPVFSLYGYTLQPVQEALRNIDLVLFDIPDVGCRFYTYLWTMTYVMEACAQYSIEMMVLDRPNPIGGNLQWAEGPMLDEQHCSSFIGRWSIPIRHCCTLGELALYFRSTRLPHLNLTVLPCQNWERQSMLANPHWFSATSPAIQDVHTAMLYPGSGWWEGLNLQEGRGTAFPFSQFGAPWLHKHFVHNLCQQEFEGLRLVSRSFMPKYGRYAGETCVGASLQITEEHLFRPVKSIVTILQQIAREYPAECKEGLYPTRVNPTGTRHLDLLSGVQDSFKKLPAMDVESFDCSGPWSRIMQPFLLY